MRPPKVILLVDENETNLSLRRFLLETHGFRVIGCESAAAALKKFTILPRCTVDLVMAECQMHGMDSDELARRVKEIYPEVPVLLYSSRWVETRFADIFLRHGFFSPADLIRQVKVLVVRKRGPRSWAARGSAAA